MPLRGKILNIEKTDDAKIYKNEEIQALIAALGLGIKGEEFDSSHLRYLRIILLTDADVDGAHIRTLLLTFFYRYQRSLIEQGYIYIGCPPLYKVERGRNYYGCVAKTGAAGGKVRNCVCSLSSLSPSPTPLNGGTTRLISSSAACAGTSHIRSRTAK